MTRIHCSDCTNIGCNNAGMGLTVAACCGYVPKDGWVGSEPKPLTNADRIRAMTDEEMAHFLEMKAGRYVSFYPSPAKCWLDWLKQEATNG